MSKDIDLVVSIGGIVDPSLGKAFDTVKARVDSLQERSRQAASLRDLLGDAIRLEKELVDMRKVGDRGVAEHDRQLRERQAQLKRLGIEAREASAAYAQLDDMQRGLDMQVRGLQRLEQANWALPLATAFSGVVVAASKAAAGYQARLRDLAIRNGLDDIQEKKLASRVQESAGKTGLGRVAALNLLEDLNATGMGFAAAQQNLGLAGRFGFGQKIAPAVTAGLVRALQLAQGSDSPEQLSAALDRLVTLGKGRIGSEVLAQRLPALLPALAPAGKVESGDIDALGALLEIQAKSATPDQADARAKAWLEFVRSGSLERAYGKDYEQELEALRKDGASSLEASLELAARYRDRGGELRAGSASPALEAYRASRGEFQALLENQTSSSGSSERDAERRKDSSEELWKSSDERWGRAQTALGSALNPYLDSVARWSARLGDSTAGLLEAHPQEAAGLTAGAGAALSGYLLYKGGRGAIDVLRGGRLGRHAAGGVGDLLGRAAGNVGGSEAQRVFVTNWPLSSMAGVQPKQPDSAGKRQTSRKQGQALRQRKGKGGGIKARSTPSFGFAAERSGYSSLGRLSRLPVRNAPLQVASSLLDVADIYSSDMSASEKTVAYSETGGSLAGSLAGAALGASIGSVVPVVGTLIGGLVGGAIGAWGGGALGASLGRSLAGEPPASPLDKAGTGNEAQVAVATQPAPAAPIPNWTFAPQINLTVQGNVHEPRRLAEELLPYLQRMLADFAGEQQRRSLYDPAMVV
ncbi:phage tail tape measure protein [Pseudomonas aeruginosa]|uniref:Putative tail length determinator protein n=1 Tax=Pseudomonas paraeruginosa (strain DSM 24068 / PA7) TaxID=381754 RepID=A6UZC9_PSEP7|nr:MULTISPECIES: phage tail length tape measure protein [Pseudomonas aeruginosa group]ABR81038.1 putative tail length determinator protein [Pseudomonas aeruginosa PA7]KSC87524.1 phage tail tape measure protein [Pseudomonas aeruginosa]KSD18225.1 phage tail tape measure protein [Pseudomonas aeruginosa]KSG50928.1 phage tail tape measure protein [Pseudomonas aeruginosa]MCW8358437.1 phage tail tape measure protein [Pseudomonas aeruginosa]